MKAIEYIKKNYNEEIKKIDNSDWGFGGYESGPGYFKNLISEYFDVDQGSHSFTCSLQKFKSTPQYYLDIVFEAIQQEN